MRKLFLSLLFLAACSTNSSEPIAGAQKAPLEELNAREIASPAFVEPVTRIRFPAPPKDLSVEVKHYDEKLPAKKFKHSIQFTGPNGVELLIDVWNNTEGLALQPWFDKYLSFLVDEQTHPGERAVTRSRLPAILLVQPQSPQALSMAVAVFAHGSQIFRVTCIDYDGLAMPQSRARFFEILEQLEVGVEP